jgi:hypothetical protein
MRHSIALLIVLVAACPFDRVWATTIVDIQKNEGSEVSPLANQMVTVEGVVTASGEADNLGAVYIQQPDQTEWAGIQLRGAGLVDLKVNDSISATGTVQEISGTTVLRIAASDHLKVIGSGTIIPQVLDPNQFTTWGLKTTEKYESMLIELRNPDGGDVVVVESNADTLSNFGEWRVGSNVADPGSGCRIVTGRQTSSVTSSLNVSYINDEFWATESGRLKVPPIVVEEGDRFPLVRGIMTYKFSNMKLLPRTNADFVLIPQFRIISISVDKGLGVASLTWDSAPGETYRVEKSRNLKQWSLVMAGIPSGGDETTLNNVATANLGGSLYYRVGRE